MKYTHSELKARFDSDLVFSIEVNTDTLKLNHKDLTFLEFFNILSLIYGQNEEINNHIDSTLLGYGGSNKISTHAYRKRIKGEEIHLCPRREESLFTPSNMDSWDKIGEDRVCSYCGSLHPEDLNKLIKKQEVEVLELTNKSYKLYIKRPNIKNAQQGAIKFYKQHWINENKLYTEFLTLI
jgi:hypothetical protein